MSRAVSYLSFLLVVLLGSLDHVHAQTTANPDALALVTVVSAVRAEEAPTLDGNVLDDPLWSDVKPIAGEFWQTTPREGQAASERTVIRVIYTNEALYIGVVCYDREPGGIIISDSRRDASLSETDSFSFILDTYQDRRNGFIFGTNPAGIEYDAQVTNEGEGGFGGGRQQVGSGGGFNINWDGAWTVHTQIGDHGWSAEFAIPFRTLRYPRTRTQTWGINFQRNIRRRNETAFWAQLPRQFNLNRVSLAGTLTGVEVPSQRNLKVMPYVLGQSGRDFTALNPETDTNGDFGVDVKYSLTPSLTLDATYNTDFAQVEVDEQQINLDRFSLFFPEKRPFFLENAGLFSVGEPGEVDLFFSRRIGISGGDAVPIIGGARLSGNVGGGYQVGLLNMQTEQIGNAGIVGNNFAVARVRRELPNRSSVGILATNRQGTGDLAIGDDYNRLVALDGGLGLGENSRISGFVSRSFTPGEDDDQYAFQFAAQLNNEAWLLDGSYTQVAGGFNPEIGFLRRSSYRKVSGVIFRRIRPEGNPLGLHELRPHISYRGFWGLDDFYETGFLHIDNHWEWTNGWELHTGINKTREGVRDAFAIANGVDVAQGEYDHWEALIVAFTDQGKPVSLNTRTAIGGFFGGDRVSFTPTLRLRAGEALTTEFSLSHNDINLPGGDFITNLFRARISYAFTPRIFIQSLLQYNDQADLWSVNMRFGWLRSANTGLFIVYNQANDLTASLGEVQARGVTLKYTHLFDVFQ